MSNETKPNQYYVPVADLLNETFHVFPEIMLSVIIHIRAI